MSSRSTGAAALFFLGAVFAPGAASADAPAEPVATAAPYRLMVPGAASDAHWNITEATDPDESYMHFNDISVARVSASSSTLSVVLRTSRPEGFSFEGSSGILKSGVVVAFEVRRRTGDSGPQSIVVRIEGPLARVRSDLRESLYETAWQGEPGAIRFTLPRALFETATELTWRVLSIDATADQNAPCEGTCIEPGIDTVPDFDRNYPDRPGTLQVAFP